MKLSPDFDVSYVWIWLWSPPGWPCYRSLKEATRTEAASPSEEETPHWEGDGGLTVERSLWSSNIRSTLEDTLIHLQENRDAREDFFWFLLNHRPEFFKDSNTDLVLMVGGYRCHLDWDQRYLSFRSLMLTDIPGYYERMVSFSQRYSQPSPLTLPTHILVSEPAAAKHKYQWFSRPQPVG